jgi:chromosomal replication initiator protein
VIFLYSGDLVTLLIDAMKTKNETGNTVDQVKAMLLDCDYFLIDDIQNLRHASSQEVFFTVYNELIREKKQIILTSDTHPAELSTLTKRLISRFSSGLTVNISKPGAETAKEILRKKINGHEDIFDIEEEVLDFLAISYSNDIRSLEGVLNRLIFNATLFNPPAIDMGFTLGVLKDEPVVSQSAEVDARAVKKAVVRYYGLSYKDIEGKSRQRKIALARQICIYLMREVLALPYAAIGMELGGRDHTTISSACSAAKKKYASDPTYKEVVDSLKAKLTVQST